MKRKKRADPDQKFSELCDAGAVIRTGMPNSTDHERRAMASRHESLCEDVRSLKRSRVFFWRK